jgi:tripartite-type tricarboxylate transporter receptor subunit TctC
MMFKALAGAVLAAIAAFSGSAFAQDYPSKQLTLVVPFAAGGPQDAIGRIVATRMSEILKQQVVVENVGGAGGMTGGKRVADAAPDGYTMILASVGTHAQGQTLYKKPLYNSVTDFTPVALIAETPLALIVRKDLPVSNLKEFVAYAKENQAKMTYGSAGLGSATHLGCVVLNYVLGTKIAHAAYRGTGPAMQDLLGGRIDLICDLANSAKPQIDGGSVKGIALMDSKRSAALPSLPTAEEQGVKGLIAYSWSAVLLPKNAPPAVVKKLNAAIVETMNTPAVKESLGKTGAVVVSNDRATPEYLGGFIKSEIEKWAAPIKASGETVDCCGT